MMWLLFLLLAVAASKTEAKDDLIFSCDFEEDLCGLKTDESRTTQWVRKKVDLAGKSGSWNVRTLHRAYSLDVLTEELYRYNLDILGLQETRWTDKGYVITVEGKGNNSYADLLSPIFHLNQETTTCLSFDLYQNKEDEVDTHVNWEDKYGYRGSHFGFGHGDKWMLKKLDVFVEDVIRMIFHGQFYSENGAGTIAIDNIEYREGWCNWYDD